MTETGRVDLNTRVKLNEESISYGAYGVQGVDITQETIDKGPDGIPMDQIPTNETCVETKSVTPGTVIAEQLSGTLKSTGIDNLINAKELTEFISAVIDAMINRVAREGLSLIKTGRGSWSKPKTSGGTQQDKNRTRTVSDIPGLEGPQAAELLNMVIDLSVNAQKLKNDMDKLGARENKTEGFASRLDLIFNEKVSVSQSGTWVPRLCAGGFRGFIDGCMYGSGAEQNLNIEANNPGLYLANKIFHQKLKEKWELVNNLFNSVSTETLITGATMQGELLKNSCMVPDIRITLNPEDEDHLPFYDGDGATFRLKDSKNKNYVAELGAAAKIKAIAPAETVEDSWETYLSSATGIADAEISANDIAFGAYDGLLTKLKEQKEATEKYAKYTQDITPKVVLFASILMDYDRAGRSTGPNNTNINLVGKFKNYNDALNNRYKPTLATAQSVLQAPKWVEPRPDIQTVTNEIALDVAKEELLDAQEATRSEWLRIQNLIAKAPDANPTTGPTTDPVTGDPITVDPIQKTRAAEKIPIIEGAVELIEQSLLPAEVGSVEKLRDPIEIGLSPSEAVGQAMANLPDGSKYKLNQSIEQLSDELELLDSQISRQKTAIGNALGKWESDPIVRAELGVEGGDSEWERYFKNRYQYAYVAFIYDFYKHYFKCEAGGGASGTPSGTSGTRSIAKSLIEYKSSGFSPNILSISLATNPTVTFKNSYPGTIVISSGGESYPPGFGSGITLESINDTRDYTFEGRGTWTFKTNQTDHRLQIIVNY